MNGVNNNDLLLEDDLLVEVEEQNKTKVKCNCCKEAQMEIQISLKVIQDLTTRISELQQIISNCQHQHHVDDGSNSQSVADDGNYKISTTTNASSSVNATQSRVAVMSFTPTKIEKHSCSKTSFASIAKTDPPPLIQTPHGCLDKLEPISSSSNFDGEVGNEGEEQKGMDTESIRNNPNPPQQALGKKVFGCQDCKRRCKSQKALVSHQKAKKHGSYNNKPIEGLPMRVGGQMCMSSPGRGGGWMGMGFGPFQVPPPFQPPPKSQVPTPMRLTQPNLHKNPSPWIPSWKRKDKGDEEDEKEEIIQMEIIHKTKEILETELVPANFDKVVYKFMCLRLEDKDDQAIGKVVHLIFEKAVSSSDPWFPTFCANLIKTLCDKLPPDTAKKFRKQFLDQCQKEFQTGGGNAVDEEEEIQKLEKELLATGSKLRLRALGNIRLVGELYKLQLLIPKIMIKVINMLLATSDEENLECLCELLKVIGPKLEEQLPEAEIRAQESIKKGMTPKFHPDPKYMDKTFDTLNSLTTNAALSSRIRRALLEVYELRRNGWNPRSNAVNPGSHFDQILPPQKRDGCNCIKASNKSTRFAAQKKKPTGSDSSKVTSVDPSPKACTTWSFELQMNEEIESNPTPHHIRQPPKGGEAVETTGVRSETESDPDDDDDAPSPSTHKNGLICAACGVSCRTERRKRKHIKNKHGVECGLCNGKFHAYQEYLKHMIKVHGYNSAQYPCFKCGSILTSKTQALKHIIKTHNGLGKDGKQLIWACAGSDGCKAKFLSLMEMESHVRREHHNDEDDDLVVTTNLLGEVRIEKRNNKLK